MRRSFIIAVIAVLVMLIVAPAFGLSDAEYRRLKRTNSGFRHADKELSEVWNGLRGSLSSKAFSELQKSQREWIRKGRDDTAKKYIREGYSRAEAYAMATNDRVEELQRIAEELKGNSRPQRTVRKTQPKPEPKPKPVEPEPVEVTKPDDDDKGEIEEDRFKNTEPGDPEGNYSSKNAFMTILITDKSSMEAEVTISINSPEEATWSSASWIDGDTLVLYDKTYSDCQATLTFQGNKVKIETSDTESWDEVLGKNLRLDGIYSRTNY